MTFGLKNYSAATSLKFSITHDFFEALNKGSGSYSLYHWQSLKLATGILTATIRDESTQVSATWFLL
ncbi:hypothetical protein NTGM5_820019 [Candidatus Nitrotoga sp. M5]|nr:hypothetical protein NTGM5_820019 [Candidatus Nitrotoga sp. M5]